MRFVRTKPFESLRVRQPGANHFEAREFTSREARDEFWEQQMLRHPDVVRDTTTGAAGAVVWRVRWPRR